MLVNKILNDNYNKELDNEVEDILFYAQDSDNESSKKIKIVYNNDEWSNFKSNEDNLVVNG